MNCTTSFAVGFLSLNQQQRKAVADCIVNYSHNPEGIQDHIAYLIYIIMENGKRILGCSDRENAIKALEAKGYQVIPVAALYFIPESTVRKTSELGLDALIKLNGCPMPWVPETVIDFLTSSVNLDRAVQIAEQLIQESL